LAEIVELRLHLRDQYARQTHARVGSSIVERPTPQPALPENPCEQATERAPSRFDILQEKGGGLGGVGIVELIPPGLLHDDRATTTVVRVGTVWARCLRIKRPTFRAPAT
jgi:hypothetical protein